MVVIGLKLSSLLQVIPKELIYSDVGVFDMSNVFIDRDGFEFTKSCAFKCVHNENKGPIGSTFCTAYNQYLASPLNSNGSSEPFASYYRSSYNDCPHFRPGYA